MTRLPAVHDYDGWVARLGVNSEVRAEAKAHLRGAGGAALPAVRRGMRHENAMVRRQCAQLLDFLADEASFEDLVAALDDPDPGVLKKALHSLACDRCKDNECRPGEDAFVPRALELLRHDNPDIRASAIDTLGKVAPRRADVAAALRDVAERDRDKGLRGMARRRVVAAAHGRVL